MNYPHALLTFLDTLPEIEQALDFELATSDCLEDMQLGYRYDIDGNDLTGGQEGAWLPQWVVIGYSSGDPLFVNSEEEATGFPVYTAEEGTDHWEAEQIAPSMKNFCDILILISDAAKTGSISLPALKRQILPLTRADNFWEWVLEDVQDALS